jgi:hypothetical protein
LMQDGSTDYAIKHKCENIYTNNNLAYFLFLLGSLPNVEYNLDTYFYCALQDIQIQELQGLIGNENGLTIAKFEQDAFEYNKAPMLRSATFQFNRLSRNRTHKIKMDINFDCPSFDYVNAPTLCNTIEDKPLEVYNPKKRPVKLPKKPTTTGKSTTTPKKTPIKTKPAKGKN